MSFTLLFPLLSLGSPLLKALCTPTSVCTPCSSQGLSYVFILPSPQESPSPFFRDGDSCFPDPMLSCLVYFLVLVEHTGTFVKRVWWKYAFGEFAGLKMLLKIHTQNRKRILGVELKMRKYFHSGFLWHYSVSSDSHCCWDVWWSPVLISLYIIFAPLWKPIGSSFDTWRPTITWKLHQWTALLLLVFFSFIVFFPFKFFVLGNFIRIVDPLGLSSAIPNSSLLFSISLFNLIFWIISSSVPFKNLLIFF